MKGLPPELIYGLIFIGFWLFQYVMRQVARRAAEQQAARESAAASLPDESAAAYREAEQIIATDSGTARAVAGAERRPERPATVAARPRHRYSRRALMGNRRAVQNAFVIATILGPCRAMEPPARSTGATSRRAIPWIP